VNDTVKLAGGSVALELDTVTVRDVVAVAPEESVTTALNVCEPLATVVVFQLKLGFVPLYTVVPSTLIW
jgi:hypothetical protein